MHLPGGEGREARGIPGRAAVLKNGHVRGARPNLVPACPQICTGRVLKRDFAGSFTMWRGSGARGSPGLVLAAALGAPCVRKAAAHPLPIHPSPDMGYGGSGSEEGSYLRLMDFCIAQL